MNDAEIAALADYAGEHLGRRVVWASVRRITVGHSRAMFALESVEGDRLVARIEQGGVFGTSGSEEFAVMHSLRAAGLPVACVRWIEPTGTVIGRPFFMMDLVDGDPTVDERELDVTTARALIEALAQLHALDGASPPVPFAHRPASPSAATHDQVERWRGVYRSESPVVVPLLEEAAAWLHRFAPPLERLSVVHGDAGPGNFIHQGGAVVALTDFEFTHLGDPDEDWSYCVSMRGASTMPRQEWLALLETAGVRLDAERWDFWDAFNLFKGACANRTCLSVFEDGRNRSPNMAIIGTGLHLLFLRRLTELTARPPGSDRVGPHAESGVT